MFFCNANNKVTPAPKTLDRCTHVHQSSFVSVVQSMDQTKTMLEGDKENGRQKYVVKTQPNKGTQNTACRRMIAVLR